MQSIHIHTINVTIATTHTTLASDPINTSINLVEYLLYMNVKQMSLSSPPLGFMSPVGLEFALSLILHMLLILDTVWAYN